MPETWRTTAFQSPMWPVDDIFVLPGVITSLCLDTVSACMGVGHLPGTHRAMICVICLKLGCFQSTSTYSTLEVSHFMYYTNSRLTNRLSRSHLTQSMLKSLCHMVWLSRLCIMVSSSTVVSLCRFTRRCSTSRWQSATSRVSIPSSTTLSSGSGMWAAEDLYVYRI